MVHVLGLNDVVALSDRYTMLSSEAQVAACVTMFGIDAVDSYIDCDRSRWMEVWHGPGVIWCWLLRLRLAVTLVISHLSTNLSV